MVRRYADPVEVRADRGEHLPDGDPPGSFLWRGRIYRVRAVLGHWRERRAWWAEAAARAVHGEDGPTGPTGPAGPIDPAVASTPIAGAGCEGLAEEREIWRVEAGAGRAAVAGVYDLCRGPAQSWSLLRVAD
jgi:hypothetical protein